MKKNQKQVQTAKKEKKTMDLRSLKMGSYHTVFAIIVIAIVVALNLIVSALPTTWTRPDISDDEMFTLSQTTLDLLDGLDKDVTFYLIANSGTEDTNLITLLDRYRAASSHISVEYVDPVSHPSFVSQYTDTQLDNNSVIAVSGEKSRAVPYTDIYTIDVETLSQEEQMYYQYYGEEYVSPNVFSGESAFSAAIDYLLMDNLPQIAVLQGHGETALEAMSSDAYNALLNENLSFVEVNLSAASNNSLTGMQAVFINLPTTDITDAELEALQTYAAQGGNIILITAPSTVSGGTGIEKMTNLSQLTSMFGLSGQDGIIMEGNPNYYTAYPYVLMPQIGTSSPIAQRMTSVTSQIFMAYSHMITIASDLPENITTYPVLSTTEDAYQKAAGATDTAKEDGDLPGAFHVGVEAINDVTGAQLVWYSSPYIEIVQNGTGNEELFLSTFLTVCDKDSALSLAGKNISVSTLTVSEQNQQIWGNVLMIGVPAVLVIIGLFVWLHRRHA